MAAHDYPTELLDEYTDLAPTTSGVRTAIQDLTNVWRNSLYTVLVTTVGYTETDPIFVSLEEAMLQLAQQVSVEVKDWAP